MINSLIINVIVCIVFPLITLKSYSWHKKSREDILTKKDTDALKGLGAFFIMFAHYLVNLETLSNIYLGPAKVLEWFGGLGVCLFFFLSGYGLYISINKSILSSSFLIKRFFKVLVPYLVLRIIFGVFLNEFSYGFCSSICYILGLRFSFWFIHEILIIYILLFWAAKIDKKNVIAITGLFLFFMSLIFLILDFNPHWYNGNLIFCLGMLFAKNCTKFIDFFHIKYWMKWGGLFALFLLSAVIYVFFKPYLFSSLIKLISGGLFSLLCALILMKIEINSLPILYIGKHSLHLYMIHLYVWEICNNIKYNLLKFILSIIVSLGVTMIYGIISTRIKKYWHISVEGSHFSKNIRS